MIFMNGRRGIMKIEEFYGEKGEKNEGYFFSGGGGKRGFLQHFFLMKSTEFQSFQWIYGFH